MRVWRAGDGPVVLAVHGLGGSGRYWQGLVDRVGDRFTIVAPDLAGFGMSDTPVRDVDRAMHLADLDALVDTLPPGGSFRLTGHSLGGVLAALWTGRHPGRVGSLAMAAAPFPDGTVMDFRSRADLRPSTARHATARVVRAIWPVVAVPLGLARGYPPAVVVDFGRQSVRARAWTMWSLWSDPTLRDEVDLAGETVSGLPVLLAHARDDRTVSVRASDGQAELLPNAERHAVAEGGHQFLLRARFEPLASWLARDAAQD
jgi:pimeloyl-ACP methyl ester carboxylesterase